MARKPKISELATTQPKTSQDLQMTQTEEQVEHSVQNRSRCGGALRAEREKQALSIQDVSNKLRLGPKQIEALEADNFASLPEPTIVRGFIRNYAKLLKINTEPLLDAYTVIVPSGTPYELTIKPTSKMHVSSKDKPKTSGYFWAGLLALMGLAVWLFYQNYIQKPNPVVPAANTSKPEQLPEPALPAAERTPELQPSTELTLPPADAALPISSVAAPNLPATSDVPAASVSTNSLNASSPVVSLPVTPVTAATVSTTTSAMPTADTVLTTPIGSMAKLEINANQETWISVTDADGKQIYDKIIFAGSRESLEAKSPLNVVIGNASGASINLNGKEIDLGPHTRSNVARIKLE